MQVTSLTLPTPQAFRFPFLSLRDWAMQMKAGWEPVGAGSLLATSYPLCPKLFFFFLLLSLGTRRTINRLYNSRHLDPSISS